MPRRTWKIPFAVSGDVQSVPTAAQSDGSVSIQQGYGVDYERKTDGTDPQGKVFPRQPHNGLLNEITASIGEIQLYGHPIWAADMAPYPFNAKVRWNDVNWRSTVANNSLEPGVGTSGQWVDADATAGLPAASQTQAGIIEIATNAEAQALSSTTLAITPGGLNQAYKGSRQLLAANGFQRHPGGLIDAWGIGVQSGSGVVIVMPVAFPNVFASLQCTMNYGTNQNQGIVVNAFPTGLDRFTAYCTYNGAFYNGSFSWRALGY